MTWPSMLVISIASSLSAAPTVPLLVKSPLLGLGTTLMSDPALTCPIPVGITRIVTDFDPCTPEHTPPLATWHVTTSPLFRLLVVYVPAIAPPTMPLLTSHWYAGVELVPLT